MKYNKTSWVSALKKRYEKKKEKISVIQTISRK